MNERESKYYPFVCTYNDSVENKGMAAIIILDLNNSTALTQAFATEYTKYRNLLYNALEQEFACSCKKRLGFTSGDMIKWEIGQQESNTICNPLVHFEHLQNISMEILNPICIDLQPLIPKSASLGIGQKAITETRNQDDGVGLAYNYAKLLLDNKKSDTYIAVIKTRSIFPLVDFFLNCAQELYARHKREYIRYPDDLNNNLLNQWLIVLNQLMIDIRNKNCWKYLGNNYYNVFDFSSSKLFETCEQLINAIHKIYDYLLMVCRTTNPHSAPTKATELKITAYSSAKVTIENAFTQMKEQRGILFRKQFPRISEPKETPQERSLAIKREHILERFSAHTAIMYYFASDEVFELQNEIRYGLFNDRVS